MAECILLKSGGDTESDDCTATKANVLAGVTAVTKDSGDEAAAGTMANKGAWTSRIGVNGKAVIPAGYHNGSGYVDQAITNRGAVNASLGINGTYAIPEGYHNGSGKVTQSIATMGAQTVTPGNAQKVVSCSGKYMTGNITVPAVSNLIAANIKKGVTVGGVTGAFDPLAGDAKDLYYFGKNRAGFSQTAGNCSFGQYSIFSLHTNGVNTFRMESSGAWNFADYSKLIIEGQNFNARTSSAGGGHGLVTKTGQIAGNYMIPSSITGTKVVYDITGVTWNHKVGLAFALDVFASISRIYFE